MYVLSLYSIMSSSRIRSIAVQTKGARDRRDACLSRPAETCFCGTFDIDAARPTDGESGVVAGDSFYLEPLT
jgi:hypothetical protein